MRIEVRNNTYDAKTDTIVMNPAMVTAWSISLGHWKHYFVEGPALYDVEKIKNSQDVEDLAAFFFWGGWLCAATRPGEVYSYTHNWPHDPLVGNTPTTDVIVLSLLSMIILFLSLFITFFVYGQFKVEADEEEDERDWQPLTTEDLENRVVRPTQRACYKFFILSAFAFLAQTFAGIVCSIDFVRPWGLSACSILPFTVWRSFHLTFQIYWFFVAWVGTTVFWLPRFYKKEPESQSALIELLAAGCAIVAVGGMVGIPLGQMGILDGWQAYYFGSQGWEFLELGRRAGSFARWLRPLGSGPLPRRAELPHMEEHVVHPGMALLWLFGDGLLPLLHHQHDPEDKLHHL